MSKVKAESVGLNPTHKKVLQKHWNERNSLGGKHTCPETRKGPGNSPKHLCWYIFLDQHQLSLPFTKRPKTTQLSSEDKIAYTYITSWIHLNGRPQAHIPMRIFWTMCLHGAHGASALFKCWKTSQVLETWCNVSASGNKWLPWITWVTDLCSGVTWDYSHWHESSHVTRWYFICHRLVM